MAIRDVVNKYFETVNAGDWDAWLELFDEKIVMDEQLGGHIEGKEILQGAIDGLKRGYSKFLNHPKDIVIENNKAMVTWHIEAANASGIPIEANGANFFIIENDKITYMANFHDTVPFKPFTDQKI